MAVKPKEDPQPPPLAVVETDKRNHEDLQIASTKVHY